MLWAKPPFVLVASVKRYKILESLRPIVTSKNGPRQQIEARTAVIPPMDNEMRVLLKGDMYTKVHSLP